MLFIEQNIQYYLLTIAFLPTNLHHFPYGYTKQNSIQRVTDEKDKYILLDI